MLRHAPGSKALTPENFGRTMDNNQQLGNIYLNLAAAEEKMQSEDGIAELADLLNRPSEECRSRGMKIGYHAHPFDFKKSMGAPPGSCFLAARTRRSPCKWTSATH